ncbi:hypothetical protein [Thermofilum adornatum]|nr:hypothetical protein [Thermofilum adornatum]AJB41937.1 hypothetical protein TCARB_0887 [Thermofilum adornatum 1505]
MYTRVVLGILLTIVIFGIFSSVKLVSADGNIQSEIEEGKKLVESGISCDKLSDEQLEAIGEYIMELMHPGGAHEIVHKMMGIEEGTEYHKQFHINLARRMYCGEVATMGPGYMMVWRSPPRGINENWCPGCGWNWWYPGLGWIVWIMFSIVLIVALIILIYLGFIKHEKVDPGKKGNILVIVLVLLILPFLFTFGWGFGFMSGMMFFALIFMVLVFVLIVWLIVSLTQAIGGARNQ